MAYFFYLPTYSSDGLRRELFSDEMTQVWKCCRLRMFKRLRTSANIKKISNNLRRRKIDHRSPNFAVYHEHFDQHEVTGLCVELLGNKIKTLGIYVTVTEYSQSLVNHLVIPEFVKRSCNQPRNRESPYLQPRTTLSVL